MGRPRDPTDRPAAVAPLALSLLALLLMAGGAGCHSTSVLDAAEAQDGPAQHFAADFERVVEATRAAIPDAGLRLEREAPRGGARRAHCFYADTGPLAGLGEVARFTVVEAPDGGAFVHVVRRAKLALPLAGGDYARADGVFREIQLRLEAGRLAAAGCAREGS